MSTSLATVLIVLLTGAGTAHAAEDVAPEDVAAEQRWVSDDLSTWVRSGPTEGYRIVGAVSAGDPVTLVETQNDYGLVRTEEGEEVWILLDDLQQSQSVQARVPALETRVQTLTERLEGIDREWEQRVADMQSTLEHNRRRVDELQSENRTLNAQLGEAQSSARSYQARLETEREDLLMRYFLYGGGVAGAGLVLGLLVPHLPKRRKKRDRWF